MFESSTNAYVYKYVMPLVGKNIINKAPVVSKTKNSKEVLANVANKSTKRKPSYSIEVGPLKAIFNAAPLEEGLKRSRKNI